MSAPLGPVQAAVLQAVAASPDGLITAEAAALLGRAVSSVHQATALLGARGYVRVLRLRRRVGTPVRVWGVTTAGREALAARREAVTHA